MLDAIHESQLVGGGDCFLHWHSSDRVITHSDLRKLQQLDVFRTVTGDSSVLPNDDFILVNTTSASVTVTLPLASASREIEIMKNAAPNRISVVTSGTDTILGVTEARIYNYGTSLRFKAVTGGWIII